MVSRRRRLQEMFRNAGLEFVAKDHVESDIAPLLTAAPKSPDDAKPPSPPPNMAARPAPVFREPGFRSPPSSPVSSAPAPVASVPAPNPIDRPRENALPKPTEPKPPEKTPAPIASPTPGLFAGEPSAELTVLTPEEKTQALVKLATEVRECVKCPALVSCRTQTVFSDGTPSAEICFVGEAPGEDEDRTGTPFVGRAGQLLTKIIEGCKLKREEVYICNVLKCRPPANRPPENDEIKNCRPFFESQIKIVRPKIIIALGKTAAARLMDVRLESVAISRIRGEFRQYLGIPVMLTYHPSYLLRNPSAKSDVWADMKKALRFIGRPID